MRTPATTSALAPLEWVALGGVLAVGAGLALSPGTIEDGPVLCPFRLLTGLPCPSCGLTRSWVYGLHGQWSDSLVSHVLGLPLLAATLVMVLVVASGRASGKPPPRLDALLRHPVAIALLVTWGAFGLLRLVA